MFEARNIFVLLPIHGHILFWLCRVSKINDLIKDLTKKGVISWTS